MACQNEANQVFFKKCLIGEHDTSKAYVFSRMVSKSLFGCITVGQACVQEESAYVLDSTSPRVAIKESSKKKMMEMKIKEDPVGEAAIQHFLETPGNPHIMGVLDAFETDSHFYVVYAMAQESLLDRVMKNPWAQQLLHCHAARHMLSPGLWGSLHPLHGHRS